MVGGAKKDEALIGRIDALLSAAPVKRKNFFGNTAWFLDSNDLMFAGAWGDGVFVRVGEKQAAMLIEAGNAEPFDPSGHRPKREYVYLGAQWITEDETLLCWLEKASEFVSALQPKARRVRRR